MLSQFVNQHPGLLSENIEANGRPPRVPSKDTYGQKLGLKYSHVPKEKEDGYEMDLFRNMLALRAKYPYQPYREMQHSLLYPFKRAMIYGGSSGYQSGGYNGYLYPVGRRNNKRCAGARMIKSLIDNAFTRIRTRGGKIDPKFEADVAAKVGKVKKLEEELLKTLAWLSAYSRLLYIYRARPGEVVSEAVVNKFIERFKRLQRRQISGERTLQLVYERLIKGFGNGVEPTYQELRY